MSAVPAALSSRWRRWWPFVAVTIVALIGYYGAWIPHRAAGLIVTGVDLAEYVKFIPQVASGEIPLLRESYYLPLLICSLLAALLAGRRTLAPWARLPAVVAAVPLALAMLPPAWSPGLLPQPEFRIQVLAIAVCLVGLLFVPLTRYLPDRLVLILAALLLLIAAVWPAWSFVQILPAVRMLFRTDALLMGWGFWTATVGFGAAALLALVGALRRN